MIIAVVLLLTLAVLSYSEESKATVIGNIISVPAAPIQSAIAFLSDKVRSFFDFFRDVKQTKEINEELSRKVNELEQELLVMERLQKENDELRDAFNFKSQFEDYDMVGSSIIAKDPGNWFDVFTIDRGSKDLLTIDSPVITAYGLVGRVSRTDLITSKVVSIIDLDSTVSARLSKSRDTVVVRGDINLLTQGLCRADYIPPDAQVSPGDTVETSGLGGIYPKGIIIGKIEKVVKNEGQYDSYAIIRPVVDFKRLEDVFVLKKKE